MGATNWWAELSVGDEVTQETFSLTRESLVRYAGASGDFNPIHYRDDVARRVGLEGVLAHGMLTMGLAISPVMNWLDGRGLLVSYQVRFTKPVYVPLDEPVDVLVVATVQALDQGQITINLAVSVAEGGNVLGKARAVVSAS